MAQARLAAARPIAPPEPGLTPEEMLERARALRPTLRARQGECEALGKVPPDLNDQLIAAGFYRIVQPRRFGGYEFDVPTFYKVMMEVSRGCIETGWVLALTSGHPVLLSAFPEQAQVEAYGDAGEFRAPAAFNPPGRAVAVQGGYSVTGAWVSASGCDLGTHFIGMAAPVDGDGEPAGPPIQLLLDPDQYRIVDDWKVMGMQGTGSKRVDCEDVFVPAHRTLTVGGSHRGVEAIDRSQRLYDNPMYAGRIQPFLIGESAAVAVGGARGALDLYETALKGKKGQFPPFTERQDDPEFQAHYGRALALIATAEAALVRSGEEFMEYAREEAAGGEAFGDEREQRLSLIEQQCVRLAWEAMELIYRTAGTSASAKAGQPIGRAFRNLAVITTHPALQMDRFARVAAATRLGSTPA